MSEREKKSKQQRKKLGYPLENREREKQTTITVSAPLQKREMRTRVHLASRNLSNPIDVSLTNCAFGIHSVANEFRKRGGRRKTKMEHDPSDQPEDKTFHHIQPQGSAAFKKAKLLATRLPHSTTTTTSLLIVRS
jgi:hypothetical protein